jgi:nucleotide-binding universal stress UspA family protein
MAQTVLAPFDGSLPAERALPYAAVLAGRGGRLVLLRVVPESASVESVMPGLRQAAGRLRRRLPRDLAISVDTLVQAGEPAATIAAAAATLGASAIVLSNHGQGGAGRWIYGSTVARILQRAETPVLLVPPHCTRAWPADGPLRIVVPLDGSDFACEVFEPLQALLAGRRGHLILVRAVEPLGPRAGRPACPYMRLATEEAMAEAQAYLDRMRASMAGPGTSVEARVVLGTPATVIVAVARSEAAHLIAISTHGSTGARPVITGSTAAAIVRHASVPVLLVHPAWVRRTLLRPALGAPEGAEPAQEEQPEGVEDLPLQVGLTEGDVQVILRGLDHLFGEVPPQEPVYRLESRLKRAKDTYAAGRLAPLYAGNRALPGA